MSPSQQKKLQELSLIFSQGKASPKQIQQLSELLAQINRVYEQTINQEPRIAEPRLPQLNIILALAPDFYALSKVSIEFSYYFKTTSKCDIAS